MFWGLSKKAFKNIDNALTANMPCSYCNEQGKASKMDDEGKCIKCHGTKLVEDFEKRKWATEEVAKRVSPPPKAVEMQVEQASSVEDLKQQIERAPAEQKDAAAKSILELWKKNDAIGS
jgi:hypothetical protein